MKLETLYMVGFDRRAPLEVIEKVTFGNKVGDALKELKRIKVISEVVVLSTCHRSEIYFVSSDCSQTVINEFFGRFFKIDFPPLSLYLLSLRGCAVVEHLFRVACGLESMVLGEGQILGQVRDAWDIARDADATGMILNQLFGYAVTCGKKARAQTSITDYPLSISYIAVKFIEKVFGDLSNRKAYVIGTGEMGRHAIKHLLERGLQNVCISNHNLSKAEELKREIPEVVIIPCEQKYQQIAQSDIVISATSAPHYTLDDARFGTSYHGRKICLVDIAVPRDIDPRIGTREGVNLYTIDDLKETAKNNQKLRENLIGEIESMIEKAVKRYIKWYNSIVIVPLIKYLNGFARETSLLEYERVVNELPDIEEDKKENIKQALERVGTKIVRRYLLRLKVLAEAGELTPQVLKVFQEK
ncbi:MAG: glutamyl-tRNA reductase [Candidatus Atribacteria bacterium]|nr:glutamyl-tRNA reductase [Candidatus Atribacteria bacterium]